VRKGKEPSPSVCDVIYYYMRYISTSTGLVYKYYTDMNTNVIVLIFTNALTSALTFFVVITPRVDDGVGGGDQYLRSDATGGWEDKDSGNDSKAHDSMASAMPLISSV
jgi:hypothetical protein